MPTAGELVKVMWGDTLTQVCLAGRRALSRSGSVLRPTADDADGAADGVCPARGSRGRAAAPVGHAATRPRADALPPQGDRRRRRNRAVPRARPDGVRDRAHGPVPWLPRLGAAEQAQ